MKTVLTFLVLSVTDAFYVTRSHTICLSRKYNVVGVCTYGNHWQKYITNFFVNVVPCEKMGWRQLWPTSNFTLFRAFILDLCVDGRMLWLRSLRLRKDFNFKHFYLLFYKPLLKLTTYVLHWTLFLLWALSHANLNKPFEGSTRQYFPWKLFILIYIKEKL
jgi:hypothetical protein